MMLTMLLPNSIEGLMGLWEEQPVSLFSLNSLKGLDVIDESPLLFKWEWISDPLDCLPDERCSPESMVGTMNHSGWEPSPFQGGEEISYRRDSSVTSAMANGVSRQ
ncbi:hypothetical protein [Saccharolobus caldissimus]|nr:hypothetical protein [Saccharolobus caldissimus]